jgi:hypothetical protein
VINLGWASVFVIETATVEGIYSRLRRDITVWRVLWVLSTGLSIFAIATSLAADAQGIADNTMTTALAYVLAFAVVVVLTRVFDGFVRTPVDRPAHRWVVVPDSAEPADPVVPAGPADREPAA